MKKYIDWIEVKLIKIKLTHKFKYETFKTCSAFSHIHQTFTSHDYIDPQFGRDGRAKHRTLKMTRVQNWESKVMNTVFARFVKDESGATAIEYGLIAALIAVAIVTSATLLGTNLSDLLALIAATVAVTP